MQMGDVAGGGEGLEVLICQRAEQRPIGLQGQGEMWKG